MRRVIFAAAVAAGLSSSQDARGSDSVRTQEIFECRSGEVLTWGDGRDRPAMAATIRFTYNPEGAPGWFSGDEVGRMVALAAAAWSQSGVPARRVPWDRNLERQGDVAVVQWSEKGSGGNFGLAN
jgi:hypothetical protein